LGAEMRRLQFCGRDRRMRRLPKSPSTCCGRTVPTYALCRSATAAALGAGIGADVPVVIKRIDIR
jgi:hypothetical protein